MSYLHEWEILAGPVEGDASVEHKFLTNFLTRFRIDGTDMTYEGKPLSVRSGDHIVVAGFKGVRPFKACFVAVQGQRKIVRSYSWVTSGICGFLLIIAAAFVMVRTAWLVLGLPIIGAAALAIFHGLAWRNGQRLVQLRAAEMRAEAKRRSGTGPWG